VLLFSLRDRENKLYTSCKEARFVGKTIGELKGFAMTQFIDVAPEGAHVEIAKHVAHAFKWVWINEDEEIERGKKGKKEMIKLSTLPLKSAPTLLKDGEQIGVRFSLPEGAEDTDDWQTLADIEAAENFRVLKDAERSEKDAQKKSERAQGDGKSIQIKFQDDSPMLKIEPEGEEEKPKEEENTEETKEGKEN
jgi:hypothetical protein